MQSLTKATLRQQSSAYSFEWDSMDEVSLDGVLYQAMSRGTSTTLSPSVGNGLKGNVESILACYPANLLDSQAGTGEMPAAFAYNQNCKGLPFLMTASVKKKAKEKLENLEFRNAMNLLKVDLTGLSEGNKILSAKLYSDIPLSGKGSIKYAEDGTAYLAYDEDGKQSIEIACGTGISTSGGKSSLYFPLPSYVEVSSLSVEIETSDGSISRELLSGPMTLERGMLYSTELVITLPSDRLAWKNSQYCAFTDLAYYEGKYYIAFREAYAHLPYHISQNGIIRIISSSNGVDWDTAATITDDKYDLRDPHMCISPVDGSLLCYYGLYTVEGDWLSPSKTWVASYTAEGSALTEKSRTATTINDNTGSGVVSPTQYYWMWNVVVEGGKVYSLAYSKNGSNPMLAESTDGVNFRTISYIPFLGNESSINFVDGRIYVLMRNQDNAKPASMAYADAPYKNWTVTSMNHNVHSPAAVQVGHKLYICGREFYSNTSADVTLFSYGLPESSSLKVERVIKTNQPGGDCAYPGILYDGERLHISYYARPEADVNPVIYYSEIPL